MTETLPAPPVPADADLRDFAFTPIYRARLFGSAFHARTSDAEWRAGVTLWLKSQDQFPAGSLPDDDIDLCRLAELGRDLKTWRKIRKGALHGWYKCSDSRLYNDVVAEVVNEQWTGKLRQRWGAECARLRKAAQRSNTTATLPSFEEWLASQGQQAPVPLDNKELSHETDAARPTGQGTVVPLEKASKRERERQGQGQGQGESKNLAAATTESVPPRPRAGQADAAAASLVELGDQCLDAIGHDPARFTGSYSGLQGLLNSGYTGDEILAAAKRCAARPGFSPPRTNPVGWLVKAVPDEIGSLRAGGVDDDDDPIRKARELAAETERQYAEWGVQ